MFYKIVVFLWWEFFQSRNITINFILGFCFKGALMQIWKSSYIFASMLGQYREKFAFLILRILEHVKFLFLFKSRL